MILRKNMRNSTVLELQQLLNKVGFVIAKSGTGSPGNESNFFGDLTEKAVINFQKANGLKADGVVGSKTWAKLAENQEMKILPIYKTTDSKEDLSDPEDEMLITHQKEELPTCPNIIELVNLINNTKITRDVNRVIFHCTATSQNATVTAIQRYWREKLGWTNPGYHILVKADGSWVQLANFNNVTNGVAGFNSKSIHISYIGGIGSNGRGFDNRTEEQNRVFETIYLLLKDKLPKATFHGHYEFSNKSCPSFKVDQWILNIKTI